MLVVTLCMCTTCSNIKILFSTFNFFRMVLPLFTVPLNNIERLVFLKQAYSVRCESETEFLYILEFT